MASFTLASGRLSSSGSFRSDAIEGEELSQRGGHHHRAVLLLVVLEDRDHRAAAGDGGAVERVREPGLLLALAARPEAARLVVGAVRRARHLAVGSLLAPARHPGLDRGRGL